MQCISCKLEENHMKLADETFVDFSIIGFKRSNKNSVLDFYYLFLNDKKEFFVMKNSFLIDRDKIDDEMAYLNHPIHELIDMNKFDQFRLDSVNKIMNKCNSRNSFYSDFEAVEILNDSVVVCYGFQNDINNKQQIKRLIIPAKIYMKIQIIKNSVIFKLPINPSIDKDILDVQIINNVDITYLGSDAGFDKGFINYYSLKDSENNIYGIYLPVVDKDCKSLIIKKNFNLKQFLALYHNYSQIDMRNILILDWIKDNEKSQVLSIYRNDKENNKLVFYILNESIEESIILHPYSCL